MSRSETLRFANAAGHRLSGRLDLPDGRAPAAYALYAPCFTCSKDLPLVQRVTAALTRAGVGVLSVDVAGLGDSEGDFADTTFSSSVSDLVYGARALAARAAAPALLVGHSLGGAAVLFAARHVPEARAVATVGAPFGPDHVRHLFDECEAEIRARGAARVRVGGHAVRIGEQMLADLDDKDEDAAAERIAALGRPLLVFHSPDDAVVEIAEAKRLYDAARHPKSFVSLAGADHMLSDPADAHYVADVVAAWATRYLDLDGD